MGRKPVKKTVKTVKMVKNGKHCINGKKADRKTVKKSIECKKSVFVLNFVPRNRTAGEKNLLVSSRVRL